MKFLFYYALKEIKGYFLRHFCIFLHISLYIFAIITLQSFILGIGRDSESSQLVLFSVILCIALFASICFMFSEKKQITYKDYSILENLGISKITLLLLNIAEVTLLYFAAVAVTFPFTRIYMKCIHNMYNSMIDKAVNNPYIKPYNAQVNGWESIVFVIVLYFIVVFAVMVGMYMNDWIPRIRKNKVFDEIADAESFYKSCPKRNFRSFAHYGITLFITKLIPSLLLCAVIYMGPVNFEWDVAISCDNISNPIPHSAVSEIIESDMVSNYYLSAIPSNMHQFIHEDEEVKEEQYYTYVQIKLNDENWVESAKSIEKKLSDYSVSVTRYGEENANIRNRMGRLYFTSIAIVLYLSSLITLLLIVSDIVKSKQKDIEIFYSLGMAKCGIIKYLVKTVQYVLRVSGVTSSMLTVLVFSLMNFAAGEKIESWLLYSIIGIVIFNIVQVGLLPKIVIQKVEIDND